MNAVAPGATAQYDYAVTGLHAAWMAVPRQDAQASAEDQRVEEIAGMIDNGTVDGGNAHFIAIVAHTVHHAASNTARRKKACWQLFRGSIGRAKTEYIGTGDRLR